MPSCFDCNLSVLSILVNLNYCVLELVHEVCMVGVKGSGQRELLSNYMNMHFSAEKLTFLRLKLESCKVLISVCKTCTVVDSKYFLHTFLL